MAFSDLISDVRQSWRRVRAVFTSQKAVKQENGPLSPDAGEKELSPEMRTSLDQRAEQVMDEYEEDFRHLAD